MSECKFCGSDIAVHAETIVTLKKRIEELETTCVEHAQIQNSLGERIKELEAQLKSAVRWIQQDCPWDAEQIRSVLENDDDGT